MRDHEHRRLLALEDAAVAPGVARRRPRAALAAAGRDLDGRPFARPRPVRLEREEPTVLVVAHGLPIRYVLLCADGSHPRPIVDAVDYATPYRLARDELAAAVQRLEDWASAGVWEA